MSSIEFRYIARLRLRGCNDSDRRRKGPHPD